MVKNNMINKILDIKKEKENLPNIKMTVKEIRIIGKYLKSITNTGFLSNCAYLQPRDSVTIIGKFNIEVI